MHLIFQEGLECWTIPLDDRTGFLLWMQFMRCDVTGEAAEFPERFKSWFESSVPSQVDSELRPPSAQLLAEANALAERLAIPLSMPAKLMHTATEGFVEYARDELAKLSQRPQPNTANN